MNKDAQMRAAINPKLIERECVKELLRAKLIECGWKDQLKSHCKEVIKEKGLEHVTVDDLVAEITPKCRALVPDSVKELLQRIRTFLAQHAAFKIEFRLLFCGFISESKTCHKLGIDFPK
ncbi:transcription and mRNA export factor ENY2-like [Delphinapterus leucas]|uniref:Transcription and mRNA export factor ENY2 n=1 Tax=Delphinapterus leucas TaxID=9749 RepID=A0A2Y9NBU0_DELLE|nr:transcription and mRNA export factor ENY2-like [Delphinapterus leucas]XP_022432349.1 transcription and mRNA export factor ENY2-like [Delphinapterus leucas]